MKSNASTKDQSVFGINSVTGDARYKIRRFEVTDVMYKTIYVINIIIYMCSQHSNVL